MMRGGIEARETRKSLREQGFSASAQDGCSQDEEGKHASLFGVGLVGAMAAIALDGHSDERDDEECQSGQGEEDGGAVRRREPYGAEGPAKAVVFRVSEGLLDLHPSGV